MARSKRIKPEILYSIDLTKNVFKNELCKSPLYTIIHSDDWYSVIYHDCCEIFSDRDIEECKRFIVRHSCQPSLNFE